MRPKGWRGRLVVLTALALLAVGAFVLWPRPDRITRENFERITEGMSRTEVYAILGHPGDYRTGPTRRLEEPDTGDLHDFDRAEAESARGRGAVDEWSVDSAVIEVAYGRSGGAVHASYSNNGRRVQSLLDNLLWRAKRQWYRWFPE
jgi:hypothetical protein